MEVHHIGYMVKKIEKSIPAFEALGYSILQKPVWDERRQASICFIINKPYCVELIEPIKGSTLYPLLKTYPNMPYHICYRCNDLEKEIQRLKKEKYMLFLAPEPAPAVSKEAKVAFLISARGGMIELLEE